MDAVGQTAVPRRTRRRIAAGGRTSRQNPRLVPVALVVLGLGAAATALVATALDAVHSPDVATSLPAAVSTVAATASAVLLGWLAVCVVATAAEELAPRRGRARAAASPPVVRRAVAALLGVAAATSTVGTAAAQEPVSAHALPAAWPTAVGNVPGAVVGQTTTDDAGPAPDRPTGGPAHDGPVDDPADDETEAAAAAATIDLDPGWTPAVPPPAPRLAPSPELLTGVPRLVSTPEQDEIVVRRGDTLWDLAARTLPVTATDAEIATEWPRWYAANTDVVGPDPDLLVPGQRLRVPAGQAQR